MFVGGCHGALHSRACMSGASGRFFLGLKISVRSSSVRNTCSLGRVHHVIGTLPGRCHMPFTVCMSNFGCHRVTSGLGLPLKAIGDHVCFAHRELRRSLGSFEWGQWLSVFGVVCLVSTNYYRDAQHFIFL